MTAVIVTVDDAHRTQVDTVAQELRERGLRVDQVLDEIGVISGRMPTGRPLAALQVDGVSSVEEAGRVQLPPPDAPVQ
ncbi:hypothetical protein DQ238_02355 [Geodermatophilus sp. TF02-6]|uniref:hypothetical protein n=1 Tax=Geodermatophilus sp. TF02-6 TaxID=2250575 RepID=UPI000DEA89DA|nr:hypothetical protein [Geodermatophilus sp. TF02-6]RBY82875.1 hypothetical protein DQ238_02355 [Geodermatophilus sp. TF02-6]